MQTTADENTVTVTYYGILQTHVRAKGEVLRLPKDATLGDLLDSLASRHGVGFRMMIMAEDGMLLPYVRIWVAGQEVGEATARQFKLQSNSQVALATTVPTAPGAWQFYEPPYIKAARRSGGGS